MVRTLLVRPALAAILLAGICAPGSAAEDDRSPFEIGIVGGFVFLDEDLAGPGGPNLEPTLGLRAGGSLFLGGLGWFADGLYSDIETHTFRLGAQSLSSRAGLQYSFLGERPNPWFVSLALGYLDLEFDEALDYYSLFVSAGVGQDIHLSGNKYLRWELRGDHSLAEDGLMGEDITHPQFLMSFNWKLGGQKRVSEGVEQRTIRLDDLRLPDRDGDGISDGTDNCPDDVNGEQEDADSDGAGDGCDDCPSTIMGIEVDERGCPLDEDGDGVYDGLGMDRCPGTPAGVKVDSRGCPVD
jgi:OOP family OmpA-OmpF porin